MRKVNKKERTVYKNILNKFKSLSVMQRAEVIAAMVLTIAVFIAVPVYAWFSYQRKAAEMFKVEYPNALYINAAHREDRIFFDLDAININDYKLDPQTKSLIKDLNGDPIKVTQMMYVFSVSGSNATSFRLQMAHTTNNLFTYTLYEAKQYTTYSDASTAANGENDLIVRYDQHTDSHTENTIQVIGDLYDENDNTTDSLFYVKGNALSGSYVNPDTTNTQFGLKDTDNKYYSQTYGDDTKVQANAVPKYWQSDVTLKTTGNDKELDANKQFCKYFILVVTWDNAQQLTQEKKESDLIYFSVKRLN